MMDDDVKSELNFPPTSASKKGTNFYQSYSEEFKKFGYNHVSKHTNHMLYHSVSKYPSVYCLL